MYIDRGTILKQEVKKLLSASEAIELLYNREGRFTMYFFLQMTTKCESLI